MVNNEGRNKKKWENKNMKLFYFPLPAFLYKPWSRNFAKEATY